MTTRKTISQREARAYRKRANDLERLLHAQRRGWGEEWPNGTLLRRIDVDQDSPAAVAITAARKLRHAVVVTVRDDGKALLLWALPHPEVTA